MARLVVPRHAGTGRFAAENISDVPPDKYKDRLVKYILPSRWRCMRSLTNY